MRISSKVKKSKSTARRVVVVKRISKSVGVSKKTKKSGAQRAAPAPTKKAVPAKPSKGSSVRKRPAPAQVITSKVESTGGEAAAAAVADAPARAPVRKIIREGKAVPVEAAVKVGEFLAAELSTAFERFTAVRSAPAAARPFSDFWSSETSPLPAWLDRECGELAALDFNSLRERLQGDEAALRGAIESFHRGATAAVEAPAEIEQRKALRANAPVEPTWRPNRPQYAAHVRAFLGLVEWQCKLAAAWPFAFARFMSKIPQQMGSDEFGALALAVDCPSNVVAELVGIDVGGVEEVLDRARTQLRQLFETECSDVHRQWNIALRGTGVVVEHLVQRYLVDSLNRDFQIVLGRMIVSALGAAQFGGENRGAAAMGLSASM